MKEASPLAHSTSTLRPPHIAFANYMHVYHTVAHTYRPTCPLHIHVRVERVSSSLWPEKTTTERLPVLWLYQAIPDSCAARSSFNLTPLWLISSLVLTVADASRSVHSTSPQHTWTRQVRRLTHAPSPGLILTVLAMANAPHSLAYGDASVVAVTWPHSPLRSWLRRSRPVGRT